MTNYDEIYEKYKDELQDVITYATYSKNASDDVEKQLFRDIAKEEHEHAEILKHILKNANKFVDDPMVNTLKENAKHALDDV